MNYSKVRSAIIVGRKLPSKGLFPTIPDKGGVKMIPVEKGLLPVGPFGKDQLLGLWVGHVRFWTG